MDDEETDNERSPLGLGNLYLDFFSKYHLASTTDSTCDVNQKWAWLITSLKIRHNFRGLKKP